MPRFNSASHQAQATGPEFTRLAIQESEYHYVMQGSGRNAADATVETVTKVDVADSLRFIGVAKLEEVEFLFEAAEHFVIDLILIAEV